MTKLEKAESILMRVAERQAIQRNLRFILNQSMPKNKEKVIEEALTNAIVYTRNIQNEFDAVFNKLSYTDKQTIRRQMSL